MAKILVTRFSALGDIAMTVPVITAFAKQYPEHTFVVLSRKFAAPLFEGLAPNISFIGVDLKEKKYKGILGIHRLFKELKQEKFNLYADLHDVLRTKLLRLFFTMSGTKVAHINKEHAARRKMLKAESKDRKQLKTSFEKYVAVFNKLGLKANISFSSIFEGKVPDRSLTEHLTQGTENKKLIGIAPFTAHKGKEYPAPLMERVVELLSKDKSLHIFLFGAGTRELAFLEKWQEKFDNVTSVAGKTKMKGELTLMEQLDVMVSMDSANMHLASLVGTKVISVWGATHPLCGFMGWGQSTKDAVQLDMPCRPCSIFGNKECKRHDYACLNDIKPETIVSKIYEVINR